MVRHRIVTGIPELEILSSALLPVTFIVIDLALSNVSVETADSREEGFHL